MKIQNSIFIKALNPILNINFIVEKFMCVCIHNMSVSAHFLIAILTKHIFIVWDVFYHVHLLEIEKVFTTPPGRVGSLSIPCLLWKNIIMSHCAN
jgi:hypothetical protein